MGAWVDISVRQPPPLGGYLHSESKMKTCYKCKTEKPLNEFYSDCTRPDGRACICKPCKKLHMTTNYDSAKQRNYMLKWKYDITQDDYDSMLLLQGGTCAICNRPCQTGKTLAVDHCHTTGKIRELLCQLCNTALGKFKDSPELLSSAITYLRKHNGPNTNTCG